MITTQKNSHISKNKKILRKKNSRSGTVYTLIYMVEHETIIIEFITRDATCEKILSISATGVYYFISSDCCTHCIVPLWFLCI